MQKLDYLILVLLIFTVFEVNGQPKPDDRRSIFPLMGDEARDRGFELPKSVGFTASYFHQNSDIGITRLGIGANTSNFTFYGEENVVINECNALINSYSFRPDVWLFPFLNIYGIFGKADVNTQVDVLFGSPVPVMPIKSNVNTEGSVFGFGAQLVVKIGGLWGNADINNGWSYLKILDEPAKATNLSFRLGNIIDLSSKTKLNVWLGAASQYFQNDNLGLIPIKNASINPETGEFDPEAAYAVLARMSGISVRDEDGIITDEYLKFRQDYVASGKNIEEDNLAYLIEKKLKQPWNVNIGAQVELNKKFQIRAEYGFLGDRTTFLSSLTYRFDI